MIVTTKKLFDLAYGKYAIGAYNINNVEQTMGLFRGCVESEAPFIIQISKGARSYTDKYILESIIRAADVIFPDAIFAVHLDHGDEQTCYDCIESGFYSSVMIDASHENTFYQVEGLMVDRGVTISHLIAVMKALLDQVFHQDVKVRLRPGYFPFVEPGFELDCQCLICHGAGCKTCKQSGWIELLPCGMVHPVVLRHGGVDPDQFSGFAFGLGLTRLAMMKYGIPEIRLMNSGDVRFLEQFPAAV